MVEFGRGCPYTCGFCSVSQYFGHRKDCRPVGEVVDEILGLPRRLIQFVDDNLIRDVARAKELLRALIPLKVRWVAQAGIEFALDDELLELGAASGCAGLLIGLESLNEESLREMGKSARQSNFWTVNLLHRAELGLRDGHPLGDQEYGRPLLMVRWHQDPF